MGSDRITVNKELGRRTNRGVEGRYNMTFCSYSVMAMKVDMTHGEFISVGLGVGL